MQSILNKQKYNFYSVFFREDQKSNNTYFGVYSLIYKPKVQSILIEGAKNTLFSQIIIAWWLIIKILYQFKYKRFYKNKYTNLLFRLNLELRELRQENNNLQKKITELKKEAVSLKQTNIEVDLFAGEFFYNLIKKLSLDIKSSIGLDFLPNNDFNEIPIKKILEQALQYYSEKLFSEKHNVSFFFENNIIIPGKKTFGLKKIIISTLGYLLDYSPGNTDFKVSVLGEDFSSLKVEIIEYNTFGFLSEAIQVNQEKHKKESFTGLFAIVWEELSSPLITVYENVKNLYMRIAILN